MTALTNQCVICWVSTSILFLSSVLVSAFIAPYQSTTEADTNFQWNNTNTTYTDTITTTQSRQHSTPKYDANKYIQNFSNENISEEDSTSEYGSVRNLYRNLFKPDWYNPLIRPVYNQSQAVVLKIRLKISALISIDDVNQRMISNVYVNFFWTDELLMWYPHKNGGMTRITPNADDIWTPTVNVYNSLGEKVSLGKKSETPPTVMYYGHVMWGFDNIFTTSCHLNMDKYPFDVQTCHIKFTPAADIKEDLVFKEQSLEDAIDLSHLGRNYGWEFVGTNATVFTDSVDELPYSYAKFTFTWRRRPSYYVINDMLPTLALSFLNCFVFLVPVESGEKIGFGVSVLLALAMFLSISSTKLPHSSDGTPAITKYLCSLFLISITAVIITIVDCRLNHLAKKPPNEGTVDITDPTNTDTETNGQSYTTTTTNNIKHTNYPENNDTGCSNASRITKPHFRFPLSMLHTSLRCIDIAGFTLIMGAWCTLTAWYFIYVNS